MHKNGIRNEEKHKKKSIKGIDSQGILHERNDFPSKWKQQKDSSNEGICSEDFPALKSSKTINLEDFPALNSNSNSNYWRVIGSKKDKKKKSNETVQKSTCENVTECQADNVIKNKTNEPTELSELQNISVAKEEKNGVVSKPDGFVLGMKNNKKKTECSQKNVMPPQRNPNKKKRTDPIFINLKEILDNNMTQKKEKSTKRMKSKFQRRINKECLSGNILDSSNPKRNRGKHREIKKQRITNLKLLIIKEKILKQKLKQVTTNSYCAKECMDFIDDANSKAEVEKYLNELAKRKVRHAEMKKVEVRKNVNDKNNIENVNMRDCDKSIDGQKQNDKKTIQSSGSALENNNIKCKDFQFSSKLREYCDNLVTPSLNAAVTEFIKELVNLQDRAFSRDPIKARAKRRHVSGIKEVKKYLILKKVKMVIIAPNLEKLQMEGSVYDLINELKSLAKVQNVPCVFALNRYKLGRCTKKNVPVSAFAIINYEGIENQFDKVMQHLEDARKEFADLKSKLKVESSKDEADSINSQLTSLLMQAFREKLNVSEENE